MTRNSSHRSRPGDRRGAALFDAIVGGVMLAIGLSVVLSVASRALTMQNNGEHRLVASCLADELLSMVLVEGPDNYPMHYDTTGGFGEPFEEYSYEIDIEDIGRGAPYRVNARVSWGSRASESIRVETLIALRKGEPEQLREPLERVDRFERYFGEENEDQDEGL